ncbi:MAG: SIS domain-containing protein, partial [Christensenellales bacterium]
SSGIAYLEESGKLNHFKCTGKIENLQKILTDKTINTNCIIAHTRWATHGKISTKNAHPHTSGKVAIVHNGIITNYDKLKEKLSKHFKFYGECDSEVVAKLIDFYLKSNTNILKAFSKAIKELEGSFAIECIIESEPNTILIARKESPIYVCKHNKILYASSDLITFPKDTQEYFEVLENEICELKNASIKFFDFDLNEIKHKAKKYDLNENKVSLHNFQHFMLKEIFDIPKALNDTLSNFDKNEKFNVNLSNVEEVHFIACGTAFHSACVGAFLTQSLAKIPAYSHIASDFIDNPIIFNKRHLYVFISQSGETFDTILALKKAKENNCPTLTITNTSYSTLANLSDYVLPIIAGKEVAVASTKVYNASNLACLYLANKINFDKSQIDKIEFDKIENNENNENNENKKLSHDKTLEYDANYNDTDINYTNLEYNAGNIKINYNEITKLLNTEFEKDFAKELVKFKTIFFIGKCEDYITAMEASLKLKEITYINCSAYPSGELKHGTLALVDNNTLVIAYLTNAKYTEKILSATSEIKTRGGKVLLISNQGKCKLADYYYKLPNDSVEELALYSIIPMQKLAYYTALHLNKNPDKPRNLAKSVTVA